MTTFHLWKNAVGYDYKQYCDNLSQIHPKAFKLLRQHGSLFDSHYEYRLYPEKGIITRRPVTDYKDKRHEAKTRCPRCGNTFTVGTEKQKSTQHH